MAMTGRSWQAVALLGLGAMAWSALAPPQAAKVSFEHDVLPILKAKCAVCHGPDSASGGLKLDTAEGFKKGGLGGGLVVPGNSGASLLIHRLLGSDGKPRMPMGFAP